jgi:hypothetical protein
MATLQTATVTSLKKLVQKKKKNFTVKPFSVNVTSLSVFGTQEFQINECECCMSG